MHIEVDNFKSSALSWHLFTSMYQMKICGKYLMVLGKHQFKNIDQICMTWCISWLTVFILSLAAQEHETYAYLIPLARAMIEIYREQLKMTNFLPHLPTTDTSPTFFEDFQSYCRSEEWRIYMQKQVRQKDHVIIQLTLISSTVKMDITSSINFTLFAKYIHVV